MECAPRLVDIDSQTLKQRVADVLVTKILAVGQDERERHIHGDPIHGPATEMRLQASANGLQQREVERPRHQRLDLRFLQSNRFTQTMEDRT